jgi:hypothetical protein
MTSSDKAHNRTSTMDREMIGVPLALVVRPLTKRPTDLGDTA